MNANVALLLSVCVHLLASVVANKLCQICVVLNLKFLAKNNNN